MDTTDRTEKFISDWLAASAGFGVLVELDAVNDYCVRIRKLQMWPKDKSGHGQASKALDTLCQLADLHGIALCGDAIPYAKQPEDAIRLRLWLARFGFEPSEALQVHADLYRPPKQDLSIRVARA